MAAQPILPQPSGSRGLGDEAPPLHPSRTFRSFPYAWKELRTDDDQRNWSEEVLDFFDTRQLLHEHALEVKLLIVGSGGSGKTCLAKRVELGKFYANYKATVGVDFFEAFYKIRDQDIRLAMWDTAGQDRYEAMTDAYFKGARAAVVAFDLSSIKSFQLVDGYVARVRKRAPDDITMFVVGLKGDLQHLVDKETGAAKARELGAEYWECSAKTGECVEELFLRIVAKTYDAMIKRALLEEHRSAGDLFGQFGVTRSRGLHLDDDTAQPQPSGSCCPLM